MRSVARRNADSLKANEDSEVDLLFSLWNACIERWLEEINHLLNSRGEAGGENIPIGVISNQGPSRSNDREALNHSFRSTTRCTFFLFFFLPPSRVARRMSGHWIFRNISIPRVFRSWWSLTFPDCGSKPSHNIIGAADIELVKFTWKNDVHVEFHMQKKVVCLGQPFTCEVGATGFEPVTLCL